MDLRKSFWVWVLGTSVGPIHTSLVVDDEWTCI
jgi:hypothetical protein